MIHELRIYRCVPGRQPALLSRFENETLRLLAQAVRRSRGVSFSYLRRSDSARNGTR